MESPAIPFNQQALRALELTKEEARTLNHNFIGTEDLLLGLLAEGSAVTDLITHGITAERVRGAIVFITGGGFSPTGRHSRGRLHSTHTGNLRPRG